MKVVNRTRQTMVATERARAFARVVRRIRKIEAVKKEIGEVLKTDMLDLGLTKLDLGRSGAVVLASGTQKTVNKGDLVRILGEAQAELVWKQIEAKPYQYLTVVD